MKQALPSARRKNMPRARGEEHLPVNSFMQKSLLVRTLRTVSRRVVHCRSGAGQFVRRQCAYKCALSLASSSSRLSFCVSAASFLFLEVMTKIWTPFPLSVFLFDRWYLSRRGEEVIEIIGREELEVWSDRSQGSEQSCLELRSES